MSPSHFKGNIYEIMAKRIQRAWRSYRTHQLIKRYAGLAFRFDFQLASPSPSPQMSAVGISSEELYPQELAQRKVTYITSLEEEE
jgi:hypothetical protein